MIHDVHITTFGYLHGAPPEAHVTLDLSERFRDPHVTPELRDMTAHHQPVRDVVLDTPGILGVIEGVAQLATAYLSGPSAGPVTIAVGCSGGRHRAPVVGAEVSELLSMDGVRVTISHRDLAKDVVAR